MLTSTDLEKIGNLVTKKIEPLSKDVKTIKSDIVHIRRDINMVIGAFDREYLDLRKRIDRIEDHLQLPTIT